MQIVEEGESYITCIRISLNSLRNSMSTQMKYQVKFNSIAELTIVRKWKHPKEFGEGQWEYEIGEAPKVFNPEADLLAPSGDNVINYSL